MGKVMRLQTKFIEMISLAILAASCGTGGGTQNIASTNEPQNLNDIGELKAFELSSDRCDELRHFTAQYHQAFLAETGLSEISCQTSEQGTNLSFELTELNKTTNYAVNISGQERKDLEVIVSGGAPQETDGIPDKLLIKDTLPHAQMNRYRSTLLVWMRS